MIYTLSIVLLFNILVSNVNYSEDISPIIYENCTECHRPGEIGAFLPLTNYWDVFQNKEWILFAITGTGNGRHGNPTMPPWPPNSEYSSLIGDRSLDEENIDLFLDWINTGSEQGNPDLEYPIPSFPDDSAIGTPDIVLTMEESIDIEGNYQDYYRCFIFELDNPDDIFFSAIEVRPGNNEALHHTIVTATPTGSADFLDAQDDGYGYECFGDFGPIETTGLLGGYAPGTKPNEWSNGLAQMIPAGWDLVVQMHYAPVTENMQDQSKINIFLIDEAEVERVVEQYTMIDVSINFPPNQITQIHNSFTVPKDVSIVSFFPHSHLLGKSWEVYAITPQNETIPFIKIDDWNFDWQNFYYPEFMLYLPSGSEIHAIAEYDNTSNNPNNPNSPPDWVGWGDNTTDEMFFLPIFYVDYQEGDEFTTLAPDEDSCNGNADVNQDGITNVLDVVQIVNYILENTTFTLEQECNSDVNLDTVVNVLDVIIIVQSIIN